MFVKQIDMAKALELAAKGMEIKVLAPIGQEGGWEILPAVSGDAPEPPVEKTLSDLTKELKQARPAAKGKLDVDIGKMKALREAGWSYAKIADEMRISEGSVYNYLKRAEEEAK